MYRISSAAGATTVENENIIGEIRTQLSINPSDSFVLRNLYFEANANTTISINGENPLPLKSDGTGNYFINIETGYITIYKVEVSTIGAIWKAVFLY